MAANVDAAPDSVQADLAAIANAADAVIPKKTDANLLIGTWNVRAFDRVTHKWRSGPRDRPQRDLGDIACITEIVGRFDVVAIQEVRRSAEGFQLMLERLGPDWAFLLTDVTDGAKGNNERLAFIYDTTRVRPSGLACELVVAATTNGVSPEAMTSQFARTPYAVSFTRGTARFTLITLHVAYGKPAARLPELKEIAEWLRRWSSDKDPWGTNLIALGDFNIDRSGDPLFDAFTSTGLSAPAELNKARRTIFESPDTAPDNKHFYDQIAWFPKKAMTIPFQTAGTLDFVDALGTPPKRLLPLSWKMSDHYPLWCEFTL